MFTRTFRPILGFSIMVLFIAPYAHLLAQQDAKMGEVVFTVDNQAERDAGVWIDGKYAGYVKELKGDRKVMLSPGEHEITIRQAGYKEIDEKINLAAGGTEAIAVVLEENPKMTYPAANAAEYRLDIRPKRAAVFVDGHYMGHGGDFGGHFHSMLVAPGKHQIKVSLDGYKTYETSIDAVASTKTQMAIDLEPGSDMPAGK
jgi:PEGA domain